MDFSSQLANLQRTAGRAASSGGGGGGDGGGRKRGRDCGEREDERRGHRPRRGFDDRRGRGGRGRGGWRHGGGRGRGGGGREADEERQLRSLVNGLPRYEAAPSDGAAAASTAGGVPPKRRHLALLFLTIDDLPFEDLWKAWLDGAGCTSGKHDRMIVSVLCHAKYPERVSSPWLRQRLLARRVLDRRDRHRDGRGGDGAGGKEGEGGSGGEVRYHSHRPEWGSVEIARGMIDLVDEALKIGAATPASDPDEKDDRLAKRRYPATPYSKFAPHDPRAASAPLPTVESFVFASETCLPSATMDEVEAALFGDRPGETSPAGDGGSESNPPPPPLCRTVDAGKSWVNARDTPNNGYARQLQWDRMNPAVPARFIWKADQWIALSRPHATAVAAAATGGRKPSEEGGGADGEEEERGAPPLGGRGGGRGGGFQRRGGGGHRAELWQAFRRVKASDEMYFPTVMSLLGIIRTASSTDDGGGDASSSAKDDETALGPEVAKRRVTYCDWSTSGKNPETFDPTRPAELRDALRKARGEGCLLARKFARGGASAAPGTGGASGAAVGGAGAAAVSVEAWLEALQKCGTNRWFSRGLPAHAAK